MAPNLEVVEYIATDGFTPFGDWFEDLDPQAAAKIAVVIERMASGNLANTKGVGEGVLERRLTHGPGYRVYFGRDGNALIILLAGGTKRRQNEDISVAKARWADYKLRKKDGERGVDA